MDADTGNTEHLAVAGAPEQLSDTVPLKVAADVRLRRYVAVAPAATGGEAVCTDQAKSVLLLLTVTVTDEEAAVPALSVATAVRIWLAFVVWVVSHDVEYGVDVTCGPRFAPSS
jgi:hypothetical protein